MFMNSGHWHFEVATQRLMEFTSELESPVIHINSDNFRNIRGLFKQKLLTFE
jgi:hypothetical protein